MNLQVRNEIGALFKLVSRKASDDSICRESDWFHNDILDSGLTRMSGGVWISGCSVGTSNTPVDVVAQTNLQSFLVRTVAEHGSELSGVNSSSSAPYWWVRKTWRFAEGVAAGNLAEVGLSWSTLGCWNRSLIKDVNGNPVVFPVLSDEYLDIISEIRVYPKPSYSGVVNFRDKLGNLISTHSVTGIPFMSGALHKAERVLVGRSLGVYAFSVYSNDIISMTQTPSGQLSTASSVVSESYGSKSVVFKNAFSLTGGAGSHRTIKISCNIMCNDSGYQFQIDPPITKTGEMELTYTFTLSWGRKTL